MSTETVGRRTRLILVVVGVLVLLLVFVGGPFLTAANEQAARPVTASGTITNGDGDPLPGISVQVYQWATHQWEAINAMDTDAAGHYRFTGLPGGRITVAFQDDSGVGYLASWYRGWTKDTNVPYRTAVPGQHLTLNGRLILGGAITGRVTLTDPSLGLIGATQFAVAAYQLIPDAAGGFSGIVTTRDIDSLDPTSDGNWRIQYLPAGSYVLRVLDNDEVAGAGQALASRWIGLNSNTKDWHGATVFTVKTARVYRAPSVHVTFDSAHPQPAVLLTVLGSDGLPVVGAAVRFERQDGVLEYSFQSGRGVSPFTDARGQLRFYRVIPGTYSLTVSAPGYPTHTQSYRFDPEGPGPALTVRVTLTR